MTGYTTYEFKIHDTMSAGLTFTNTEDYPVTVKIGTKTLAAGTDYTFTTGCTDGCDFEIYIADMTNYTTGDKIVVTYYATINEGALNTSVETNEIYLEYSNNPYTKGTGKTPKHIVYVYDFDIVIDKYANITEKGETVKNPLAGAKFVLRNADGDYYYWNATTKKVEWYKLAEKETIEAALAAGKPIRQT